MYVSDLYNFEKIQTFATKNRPNKDPIWAKGLYYRPGSLNKDPTCHTAKGDPHLKHTSD